MGCCDSKEERKKDGADKTASEPLTAAETTKEPSPSPQPASAPATDETTSGAEPMTSTDRGGIVFIPAKQKQQQQHQQPAKGWGHEAAVSPGPAAATAATAAAGGSSKPASSASSSPYALTKLPPGCIEAECHHVYDGDTLTLNDERRVRLLGIDCPELKEKEPFAEEAKDFTKQLCAKRHLWLLHEGPETQDKYGRLLCWVYVHADGATATAGSKKSSSAAGTEFICVNEAIVAAGLAKYYHPGSTPLGRKDHMLAMQHDALAHKRGIFSKFVDDDVVFTTNGKCYHKPSCANLAEMAAEHGRMPRLTHAKRSAATEKGLSACRTCLPGGE